MLNVNIQTPKGTSFAHITSLLSDFGVDASTCARM